MAGEGKEGDWECGSCNNRNYAFRSVCNRCKHPRLLVDNKTPPHSKWLPRIGDWICTACTNNNYASREKCKKCGQPKELASVPAIALPGDFARAQGALHQAFNMGLLGNDPFQLSFPLNKTGGVEVPSNRPITGAGPPIFRYGNNAAQFSAVPNGWRNGDWICNCGFHNYSSRAQCKKCSAAPPALGIKRLASEDLAHALDNKRLNAGQMNEQPLLFPTIGQSSGSVGDHLHEMYKSMQVTLPQLAATPALIGKGAKQWREGDWLCTNCKNHNYASRSECNRCNTQRSEAAQPVGVD